MNVYYFYSQSFPEAIEAAKAVDAIFIDTSKDGWEYGKAVQRVWELNKPFILIEQDMIATSEIIKELTECSNKMCLTQYWYHGHLIYDTGISKWTPHPLEWSYPKHWIRLMTWLLGHSYHQPHNHGYVRHLGHGHTNAP